MDASIYRLRLRDILTVCVFALLAMGVLMVQSASTNVTAEAKWQWSLLGQKHLIYVGCSILAFFIVGRCDYARLGRPAVSLWRSPIFWFFFISLATCAVVLVPHVGARINGAQRWLKLGQITLQPSELAKWAVVLFLAYWLTREKTDIRRLFGGLIPTLLPVGLICLLVVIQDFGTAALIGLCALTMLLAARMRLRHLLLMALPVAMAGGFFVLHSSGGYRMRRITAFLHPYDSPQGEGYHMIQSLLSFSSGGVFGRGLGNGIQKLGYLPEDTTDFIFAVICEELGLFGAMLAVALYLGVLFVAWQVIRQKRDAFGRMLAFGIGSMIGLQAAINVAVATVSVPTKGLSLPLISAGGSGLVITCGALGLLYSITRYRHPETAAEPASQERPDPASTMPALT